MRAQADVVIVIPAGGRSSRFGAPGDHKLLALIEGEPMLRRVARTALASGACRVIVVTGFRRAEIEAALAGLQVDVVHNPAHEEGMGTTLATAFRSRHVEGMAGAVVMLADMPAVTAGHIGALIGMFRATEGACVVRAAAGSVTGHPVLLPASLFDGLRSLGGDKGARNLIETAGLPVLHVEIGHAALMDIDRLEDLPDDGNTGSKRLL